MKNYQDRRLCYQTKPITQTEDMHAWQFRDPGQRGTGTKPGVFSKVEQKASFSHVREG